MVVINNQTDFSRQAPHAAHCKPHVRIRVSNSHTVLCCRPIRSSDLSGDVSPSRLCGFSPAACHTPGPQTQHQTNEVTSAFVRVCCGSMLSKKDFEGGLCAILIQEKYTTENIDSRNRRLGVKDCTLTEGRRLFRQHRSKREFPHFGLMSASSASSGHWVANASAALVESRMGAVAWAMRQRSVSHPRSVG